MFAAQQRGETGPECSVASRWSDAPDDVTQNGGGLSRTNLPMVVIY